MHPAGALFLLPSAVRRDPAVDSWLDLTDPMRMLVRPWFELMRSLGPDVRECLHDHMPTACVGDAAFAYVNAFTAHAAIGFFNGSSLPDPAGILEGSGKRMRHVKLRAGAVLDEGALRTLVVDSCERTRAIAHPSNRSAVRLEFLAERARPS